MHQLSAHTRIRAEEIVQFTRGTRTDPMGDLTFSRVCTDSRAIEKGDVFVALRGERFDGHSFLKDALEKGAQGLVVDKPVPAELTARYSPVVIMVEDTLQALGDMAAGWRRKYTVPVGVLTGTNGKTTTKEMTACILKQCFSLLYTQGNFNNLIGLPLTLLELASHHERVLLEMGMNRPGEIRRLTTIAQPQYGALLNIGPAHLERFRDIHDIAEAKAEMAEAMNPDGVLIFNLDDPLVREIATRWKGRTLSYGSGPTADVRVVRVEEARDEQRMLIRWGSTEVEAIVKVPGTHNRVNALAAAAIAFAMGAEPYAVQKGLEGFVGVPGRLCVVKARGITLIDDTYNANPRSMESAFETLVRMSGKEARLAVLGDMLELGTFAEAAHRSLGNLAAGSGLCSLILIGAYAEVVREGAVAGGMKPQRVSIVSRPEDAAQEVLSHMNGHVWVLVKGSRGMQMERVVRAIQNAVQDRSVA